MLTILTATLTKEFLYAKRNLSVTLAPFIVIVIALIAINVALNAEVAIQSRVGPVIIWAVFTLTLILAIENSYQEDLESGALELLAINANLRHIVLSKAIAQTLIFLLPICLLLPVIIVLFSLEFAVFMGLSLVFLITTPLLVFVSTIGVGLTMLVKRGGMLLGVVILPLLLPVFIFASSAIELARVGASMLPLLAFLGALLIIAVWMAPIITGFCIKHSV